MAGGSEIFEGVVWPRETISEILERFRRFAGGEDLHFFAALDQVNLSSIDEWLERYELDTHTSAYLAVWPDAGWTSGELTIDCLRLDRSVSEDLLPRGVVVEPTVRVTVSGLDDDPSRSILELAEERAKGFERSPRPEAPPRVFLGHGLDHAWKDLRMWLQDTAAIEVRCFESEVAPGSQTASTLSAAMQSVDAAILVFTAEDQMADGRLRARQNVVHEAGIALGRFGAHRCILVVQDGVDMPSNLSSTHQLRFDRDIRTTFGDVLHVIHQISDPRQPAGAHTGQDACVA